MTVLHFSDDLMAWVDRYGITWSFDPMNDVWVQEKTTEARTSEMSGLSSPKQEDYLT